MADIDDRGWRGHDVTVAVASGTGNATSGALTGRFVQIDYIKDGTAPYDANATFTATMIFAGGAVEKQIFASVPGQIDNANIFPISTIVYDAAGADSGIKDCPVLVLDTVRINVIDGGTNKTGVFRLKVRS